jgi:hypothetical protein
VLFAICVRRAREQGMPRAGLSVEPPDAHREVCTALSRLPSLPSFAAGWLARIEHFADGATARRILPLLASAALVLGVGALLLAPATWVALSITRTGNEQAVAGPAPTGPFGGFGGGRATAGIGRGQFPGAGSAAQATARGEVQLVRYLDANRGSTRYLLATQSAMVAAPFILQTGQPVMALGGFSGTDPIVTTHDLQQLVATHDVRYFLLQGNNPFGFGGPPADDRQGSGRDGPFGDNPFAGGGFGRGSANGTLMRWIETSCAPVPASTWGGTGLSAGVRAAGQLYDCAAAVTGAGR